MHYFSIAVQFDKRHCISIRSAYQCALYCQTIAVFCARIWICECNSDNIIYNCTAELKWYCKTGLLRGAYIGGFHRTLHQHIISLVAQKETIVGS